MFLKMMPISKTIATLCLIATLTICSSTHAMKVWWPFGSSGSLAKPAPPSIEELQHTHLKLFIKEALFYGLHLTAATIGHDFTFDSVRIDLHATADNQDKDVLSRYILQAEEVTSGKTLYELYITKEALMAKAKTIRMPLETLHAFATLLERYRIGVEISYQNRKAASEKTKRAIDILHNERNLLRQQYYAECTKGHDYLQKKYSQ